MSVNGEVSSQQQSRPRIDYSDKDYDSLREALLALAKEKLPSWTDHSENDPGVVLLELFAYLGDILLYYQDRIANESFLDTALERRSVMNHLRLIGCELRPSQSASIDLSLLFNPEMAGTVTIRSNAAFKTKAGSEGPPSVSFAYVGEALKFELASLPATTEDGKRYRRYTLPVVQIDSVKEDEPIGVSDGSSGQRFRLSATTPIVDNSVQIRVESELWTRRDTLYYSVADSKDYVVRRDENEIPWIEFGDGKFGRIPPRGGKIRGSFWVGGGVKGNVPAGTGFQAVSGITVSSPALQGIVNPKPGAGGADFEEADLAIGRGTQLFRARSRAVTAEDYEAYARDFGIAKVTAVPGNWNSVELYLAPAGGGYLTETLKEGLRLYFDDKRMVTCKVEFQNPRYVPVTINGELYCKRTYVEQQVKLAVEDAVKKLLSFDAVTFGDVLYISDVYKAIEEVPGVEGVSLTWYRSPAAAKEVDPDPDRGVLRFDCDEIPQFQGISLTVEVGSGGRRGY